MVTSKHICMLAAENDVIRGAKVGGIGDVVRDIPRALANEKTKITVIIPAYGAFHERSDANCIATYTAVFRASPQRIELYEVAANRDNNVRYLVMHHPLFALGGVGKVYCDDDASQPFATDANKFALFSVASLCAITSGAIDSVDVLHLHDWHAAIALPLIRFDPEFQALKSIRTVYSIHNLALQGIRPFAAHASSFQAWFPHLHYSPEELADPRWPECINPVAGAIRLAHKLHTVSPTYAQEILDSNDPARGFHGGEGLEADLQHANHEGRLIGIINGIDYAPKAVQRPIWQTLTQRLSDELLKLMARSSNLRSVDYLAHQRLLYQTRQKRPTHVLTSVGRLTDQKMALLLESRSDGNTALEQTLELLDGCGLFLLLGSGDATLEEQCCDIASRYPQMIFINQYSVMLSDLLFANGDVFVMPSSFEPCGISQMLAMKDGQPCIAHAVGGLADTIEDNVDGFLFRGDSFDAQSDALVTRTRDVLQMRKNHLDQFTQIASTARKKRFEWSNSAARYHSELYS